MRDEPFSAVFASHVDEFLLDATADATRTVALAVAECCREFGRRVAAVDCSGNGELDAPGPSYR